MLSTTTEADDISFLDDKKVEGGGGAAGKRKHPEPINTCALCFRALGTRWTTGRVGALRALVRLDAPPYADVVLAHLCQRHDDDAAAALCEYCASFLKERSVDDRVCPGRKHGMQLTVEHVLSGGSAPAPCRPHFLRCLGVIADRPDHPYLAVRDGDLRDRLLARDRLEGQDCLVRWLLAGRPRIFRDARLAKHLRHWFSLHPFDPAPDLPVACRRCAKAAPIVLGRTSRTYGGALLFASDAPHAAEEALVGLEDGGVEVEGLLHYCIPCRRVTAIAYEYDAAVRARLGLQSQRSAEAYYTRLITLARARLALLLLPPQ